MTGYAGNNAWFCVSKQSALGSVPATVQYKNYIAGGAAQPERVYEHFNETDASRDQGDAYVSRVGAAGSVEIYVRDASIGMYLLGVMGLDTPSGSTNYTHDLTFASTLPYLTFWRMQNDLLWERYNDCLINSLTFRAEAGQPLTCAVNFTGRSVTRLTADPTSPAAAVQAPYTYNEAAVTMFGGATTSVSSMELTIENSVTSQQTDDIVPIDVIPGKRSVSLAFDTIFSDILEYTKFHYGVAGTTQIGTVSASQALFSFTKGANNWVTFNVTQLAYEEFPLEPNVAGEPVIISGRGTALRQVGAGPMTAQVKNQVATYPNG